MLGPDRGRNDPGSELDRALLDAIRAKDKSLYDDLSNAWKCINDRSLSGKTKFFQYWISNKPTSQVEWDNRRPVPIVG